MINYLVFALFLIFPLTNFAQDIKDILSKIPSKDKQALERLFYWIMHNDHGNYTLFGEKPISLSGDFIITPIGNLIGGDRCGGIFWKILGSMEKA